MTEFIIIMSIYIATVLLARHLNYYCYIRGWDSDIIQFLWFIPFFNMILIIAFTHTIIEHRTKRNILRKIGGAHWEDKKREYEQKIKEKEYKQHKEIDPYGEEDWKK